MANVLNFNTIKKRYLTVTLPDEANTVLMIGAPTKKIMDNLIVLQASVDAIDEDNVNSDAMDDLYSACANIMSRNKCGIKITADFLSDLFDFEDIKIFFKSYMEFVTGLVNEKN